MARVGVNYFDVAKAAEAIKTQSQEPTVDRVRERLGTGSKSTIAPLLKRWRSDNSDSADVSGLPNDLVEVVKSLHQRVQQMADHRIEQARQEFKASSDELQKELAEDRNTILQLTARQQDLERQIVRITDEKNLQGKSLEDTRVHLAKIESQRDEATARVSELKETVAELKQENRDIRDHFEHYQQRTAEDRQLERDQFRATNQQLQTESQRLAQQLGSAEAQILEQIKERSHYQSSIDDLSAKQRLLQQQLSSKDNELGVLNEKYQYKKLRSQKLDEQNNELQQRLNSLIGMHSEADKEIEVLKLTLKKSASELCDIKDKNSLLTEENKLILQEKAILQGQFTQLQSSI